MAGIGATATAGIAATATAGTATAGIGPAMELSAAKCAGARYGVQGTFAVNGIDTLGGGGLRVAPTLFGRAIDLLTSWQFSHWAA